MIDVIAREHGLTRGALRAYRLDNKQAANEWYEARKDSADAHFDRAATIANAMGADPASARVAMQFHQWAAEKRDPDGYGQRVNGNFTHTTVDLTAIIQAASARLQRAREPITIEHEQPTLALVAVPQLLADLM